MIDRGCRPGGVVTPSLQPILSTGPVDKSLGLVAVIAPRVRKLHEEHVALQSSLEAMSERISQAESPVVFVEGPTDVKILQHARSVLNFEENYRIECANGANDITAFLKQSSRVKPDDRPLLGVYDGDATGRAEFAKCKAVHKVDGTDIRILDKKKRIYAGILSLPEHLEDAGARFKAMGVEVPLPIEFMLTRDVIEQAEAAGVLALVSREAKISNMELPISVRIDEIADLPDDEKYLCKKVAADSKTAFANWVVTLNEATFEPFRAVLADIEVALSAPPEKSGK